MKLSNLWVLPFFVQGLVMFVDEFYFHLRRGLPLWERIGHPIDTFSVVLCYGMILWLAPTQENLVVYGGLCLFSCALVTKDEFVHRRENCSGGENWLHSVLFVLHPLVLSLAGLIWYDHSMATDTNLNLWMGLKIQAALTVVFLLYQVTYWSFLWKPKLK